MDLNDHLLLSYYKTIAVINEKHNVTLVQHSETHKFYVKKILDVYDLTVYEHLKYHPVPGIPRIYVCIEDEQQLILIEEYISGSTLSEILQFKAPLPTTEVQSYLLQLCDILDSLHSCTPAIIHRDIKPSNIIVTSGGVLYLIDQNAAKWQHDDKNMDSVLLGTPGYAAPEQYGFGTSGPQTDIYALGILMQTLLQNDTGELIIPSRKYKKIISKCTKLEPKKRFRSIKELRHAIKAGTTKTQSSIEIKSWYRFLPPGFRTMTSSHMATAILGYGIVFSVPFLLNEDVSIGIYIFDITMVMSIFLFIIFFSLDYAGVHKFLPLCKSKYIVLRVIGILLFDSLITLSLIFLMAIIYSIISMFN